MRSGVGVSSVSVGGATSVPLTLANMGGIQDNATTWRNVPYDGNINWTEPGVGSVYQVFDIQIPAGTAPAGGWPVIVYFHANTSDHIIGSGSVVDTNLKQPALAAGIAFASVEFRHPVANVSLGAPHHDAGRAIQKIRALHKALNLNRDKVCGALRSRGNLALWSAVAPDLRGGGDYTEQQSSRLNYAFCVQPQVTYSTTVYANNYVQSSDRAAFLSANPDDARWGSAIDLMATTDNLIPIAMNFETAELGTFATLVQINAGDSVHWPDAGRITKAAYAARGASGKISTWDSEPSGAEQWLDCVQWFQYLMDGMTSAEALAMARAKRKSASAHYIRADLGGAYQLSSGSGTPFVGGPVGAVVAGEYGIANRVSGTPSGYGAGQSTAANRPTLSVLPSGQYGLTFDSTDRYAVPLPSAGTPTNIGFTVTGEVTTLASTSTTNYVYGDPAYTGLQLILEVGTATTHSANDLKIYRRFAQVHGGI